MEIPVTQGGSNDETAVDVRIEETAEIDFALGESSQYADVGDVSGRLIVEYEVNRGRIVDELERVRDPGLTDRLDMFLRGWSDDEVETETLVLDFGTLLVRGTEPLDEIPSVIPLRASIDTETFESTSPTDLKRELREGVAYTVQYERLADDIRTYLENEGISAESVEMGVPVHVQARAEPVAEEGDDPASRFDRDVYGTEFTITIDNRVPREIAPSTVRVQMRPRIGREVVPVDDTAGSYNPADEVFEIEVPRIGAGSGPDGGSEELSFVVPQSAGATLDRLEGTATLNTDQPFTNYVPEAVFDAGGRRASDVSDDGDYASVNWTCSIDASFHVETEAIVVGDGADIEKRVTVDGVPPTKAEGKIETILAQRGIDSSGGINPERTETREGTEVTTFEGEFDGGSVVVGGSRINVDIRVSGERRTGEAARQDTSETDLPTRRRNTTFEYGRTGLVIRGRGADPETVESYVGDLRSELKMSLESLAEDV